MKKIITLCFGLFVIVSCKQNLKHDKKIDKYIDFLELNKTNAKDYVLDLFEYNDLVILCERDHRENTQYDFITELVSDERFVKNVGNIFTEVGMNNLNPELNEFIQSENLTDHFINEKLIGFQRKSTYYPLWGKFNFYSLNKELYNINKSLSKNEKLNIYPTNIDLKLDSLNFEYYKSTWNNIMYNRDSLMAQSIIDTYKKIKTSNSKRKKALIIMNYRHAFNLNFKMPNGNIVKNTGSYLFDKYSGKIANVLINQFEFTDAETEEEITYNSSQKGKWDAAFEVLNIENSGFNFNNSPFGKDHFDLWPFHKHNYTYKDMFTGFIYYKKPKDFKLITGVTGLIDTTFLETYKKRTLLWKKISNNRINYSLDNDKIYEEYNIKKEIPIERIDSISAQINRWISD
jgi:hypothetical protein